MNKFLFLFDEWWYVLILAGVMLVSGLVKKYNLFYPIYEYLIRKIKNKKFLVAALSFISGVLPIPGRVIVSAGMLDTIAPIDPKKRSKFGIIDYLATHHYYLWSPLEKTVLIPMAVLKLSYLDVLSYTWPLLLLSILFLIGYIWTLKSDDITIRPISKSLSNVQLKENPWYRLINWKTLGLVLGIIILGNYVKQYGQILKDYVELVAHGFNFVLLSIVAFLGSFILGSSSKFAGMTALLTSIFGLPYFTYLFAIEFAGYLLSYTHKCIVISHSYFGTPLKSFYKVIGIWCILIILVGLMTICFI